MPAHGRTATSLDLPEMARRMVDASTAITTGRLRLFDPAEVQALLARNEPGVVAQFRRELARQIAAALLWMDPQVVAVYEDRDRDGASLAEPLRLIVRVDSETAALRSLVSGLGSALAQVRIDGVPEPASVQLDPLIVDRRSARLLRDELGQSLGRLDLLVSRDEVVATGQAD